MISAQDELVPWLRWDEQGGGKPGWEIFAIAAKTDRRPMAERNPTGVRHAPLGHYHTAFDAIKAYEAYKQEHDAIIVPMRSHKKHWGVYGFNESVRRAFRILEGRPLLRCGLRGHRVSKFRKSLADMQLWTVEAYGFKTLHGPFSGREQEAYHALLNHFERNLFRVETEARLSRAQAKRRDLDEDRVVPHVDIRAKLDGSNEHPAWIVVNRKLIPVGIYETLSEARNAACQAAKAMKGNE